MIPPISSVVKYRALIGTGLLLAVAAGDPKQPAVRLSGTATVEEIPIHLAIRGTPAAPDMQLTSVPPMDQDLLLMLLTGSCRSSEDGFNPQRT